MQNFAYNMYYEMKKSNVVMIWRRSGLVLLHPNL